MRGSLQKVKDHTGQWVWRAQWRENGRGRTHIIGTVREMSRAAALQALAAIVAPINAQKKRADASERGGGLTVAQYIEREYLPSRSELWKRSTEVTTTALIERHIFPHIGTQLLTEVTRKGLQALLGELAAGGASASVVDHVRFQLRAIFELAAGDGRIMINPTLGLHTPKAAKRRQAPELAPADKMAQAMMALEPRDRLFVALAVWRGMRPGEISALQVGDVGDDTIQVRRRVYMGVVDSPKSGRGVREVPIGGLAGLLQDHIASLANHQQDAWLFPSEAGDTPIAYKNLYQRRLEPVFKAAGLHRINYQAMRATFATETAAISGDAKVRADLMGHTVDVHEQVYRQSTAKQRAKLIKALDKGRLQ